jgi:cell filamentation protein
MLISRYDVSGSQGACEPGSNGLVLKNLLGIQSVQEINDAEARALEKAMLDFLGRFDENHRFSVADICLLHQVWLGDIYEWAGEYRQVNVSKGDFPFASAAQVPFLLERFEKDVLDRHTPCHGKDRASVMRALAETHVELVLIHPFREGNGRVARILSTLMALQARLPLLDFSLIAKEKKQSYFAAVQAGLDRDYAPMERLFLEIIERSLAMS